MQRSRLTLSIRSFEIRDLSAAIGIQSSAYPAALWEDAETFTSRLNLNASYCLVAERGGAPVGYLIAHGWPRQSPPEVRSRIGNRASEVLFIHDLAVAAVARGSGVGAALIARAFRSAAEDGLRNAELIAVAGAAGFWRTLGFSETAMSRELSAKVAKYGPEARWMERAFT